MKKAYFFSAIFIFLIAGILAVMTFVEVDRRKLELIALVSEKSNTYHETFLQISPLNYQILDTDQIKQQLEIHKNEPTQRIVFDGSGNIIAFKNTSTQDAYTLRPLALTTARTKTGKNSTAQRAQEKILIKTSPLIVNNAVAGVLVTGYNIDFIDESLQRIWMERLIFLIVLTLILICLEMIGIKQLIVTPVKNLAQSIKLTRVGNIDDDLKTIKTPSFFDPLVTEVTKIKKNLITARLSAIEEARLRIEKIDSPWTAQRLQEFVKEIIQGRPFIVVSNREPYVHTRSKNGISYYQPASGMVTALEPIMQACGGKWIAHGSGNADRDTVDIHNSIPVPPEEPAYTLHRVWLTEEEEKRYYGGFSNEGLWALCHNAHTRPEFRTSDWQQYQEVNHIFAKTVLAEIKNLHRPIILVQDFHLALLPQMIKKYRSDCQVGLFWHIPWPNPESFSICPWKRQLLDGLLGADLIGFHTQLHCNNFIDTVSKELEALIDTERFAITRNEHTALIRPFPISIAFSNNGDIHDTQHDDRVKKEIKKRYGVNTPQIAVGVDRLDYTKGILERLKAVELLFKQHPEYKQQFCFIQIAAPSRTDIKRYQQFADEVQFEVDRINGLLKTSNWQPVIYLKQHFDHEQINAFYRVADICLVTSLHDGMNLVSKEYIAARSDNHGVLILSQFAGSSRELTDALIVNPYNALETAEAIYKGLKMSIPEQERRMKRMRSAIKNYNIYRWSADLLKTLIDIHNT